MVCSAVKLAYAVFVRGISIVSRLPITFEISFIVCKHYVSWVTFRIWEGWIV